MVDDVQTLASESAIKEAMHLKGFQFLTVANFIWVSSEHFK
jgi:hypothetical protein